MVGTYVCMYMDLRGWLKGGGWRGKSKYNKQNIIYLSTLNIYGCDKQTINRMMVFFPFEFIRMLINLLIFHSYSVDMLMLEENWWGGGGSLVGELFSFSEYMYWNGWLYWNADDIIRCGAIPQESVEFNWPSFSGQKSTAETLNLRWTQPKAQLKRGDDILEWKKRRKTKDFHLKIVS